MRKEKGITMVTLVITIMVLVILASVAIYSGATVIQTSKLNAFTTELKLIQTEVNAMYEENSEADYGKTIIEGSDIGKQANKVFSLSESGITDKEGYKYWDIDTIRSLGIDGIERTFFVNLKKRSVVSYEGLEFEGKMYYTLQQLPEGLYNVEYNVPDENEKPTFNVDYEYIGVNKSKVIISNINYKGYIEKWQVKYKLEENENWNTSEDLSFVVDQVGTYKIILQNGSIQSEEQEIEIKSSVKAVDIVNNPSEYYGAVVTGYNCANSKAVERWKIFYAEGSHIYLIADDYIASNYVPKGKAGSSINTNGTYRMYFEDILNDYEGASDITISEIKALNNDYFNTKGYSTTNNSMKAVAYMLDTNAWSDFKGDKASYAIGGPTVEILMKSYSQKYNVDYRAQASSASGYQISKDAGVNWANHYDEILDTNNTLYVIENSNKAISMWLASPSNLGTEYILTVYYSGNVGIKLYSSNTSGFRPLVCLKSNVELIEKEDGVYKIVD